VKIADFGLAKLMGPSKVNFTLTGSQQIMGTLDYMAPEQRLKRRTWITGPIFIRYASCFTRCSRASCRSAGSRRRS